MRAVSEHEGFGRLDHKATRSRDPNHKIPIARSLLQSLTSGRAQQERLEQLELYLQTTWDTWMDDMAIGGMVKLEATNES